MAVTTAEVNGTTTPNDWILSTGVSKESAVNSPDDDATSYIDSSNTSGTIQTFTVTPALNQGEPLTQIGRTAPPQRGGFAVASLALESADDRDDPARQERPEATDVDVGDPGGAELAVGPHARLASPEAPRGNSDGVEGRGEKGRGGILAGGEGPVDLAAAGTPALPARAKAGRERGASAPGAKGSATERETSHA